MTVEVYKKEKGLLSPELFEDYDNGLFSTVYGIDIVEDIGTDWDLVSGSELVNRYNQKDFYLVIRA